MFSRAALLSFLTLAPAVFGAAIKREPHSAEIVKPASGGTIWSPNPAYKDAKAYIDFELVDGEPINGVEVRVSLKNSKGVKHVVADKIKFDHTGTDAATTLEVCFDTFPDGAYTLIAEEVDSWNQVQRTISQPLDICQGTEPHAPRAPHGFEILEPAVNAVVKTPGGYGSFKFSAADGEQHSQYYVEVFLKGEDGKTHYVSTVCFDGYVADVTIDVDTGKIPCGKYELIAREYPNGSDALTSTLSQEICIE